MNPIQKSPHYPQLRQSLEYAHCRKQFLISLAMVGVVAIPTFVLLGLGVGSQGKDVSMVLCVLLSLGIVGLCIYNAYRWREIFLHMDDYMFFTAVLSKPIVQHTRHFASVSYSLTFPNSEGTVITRQTSSMFHDDTQPCLEDYNGKSVRVGYNETTDRLVVIGRPTDG